MDALSLINLTNVHPVVHSSRQADLSSFAQNVPLCTSPKKCHANNGGNLSHSGQSSAEHQKFTGNEEVLRLAHKLSLTLLIKHIDSDNDKE
jgi:hypothetical protein